MSRHGTEIDDERQLLESESALLRWLLSHGNPNAAGYLVQVPEIRVISRCACGCGSLNFDLDGKGWRSQGGVEVLSEHQWRDGDGHLFGSFAFAKAKTLAGIDVYSIDGLSLPRRLPAEADLSPLFDQVFRRS